MEKNKDTKVFMLCHKPVEYGFLDNEFVTPLECGAAVKDNNACETKDNTGDNISEMNQFYTEDTGIYWIWKNVNDCKYKGQIQYRRRFKMLEGQPDFDEIFKEHDAIIAEPMNLAELYFIPSLTLETQYLIAHNVKDLHLMELIIKQYYPQYSEDFDKYIKNGNMILYSNGFILRKEDYNKYCEELFFILGKWLEMRGISNVGILHSYVYDSIMSGDISDATMDVYHRADLDYAITYQSRIGGSLAERFFTLYAFHNFKNILFVPYDKPEGNKL